MRGADADLERGADESEVGHGLDGAGQARELRGRTQFAPNVFGDVGNAGEVRLKVAANPRLRIIQLRRERHDPLYAANYARASTPSVCSALAGYFRPVANTPNREAL